MYTSGRAELMTADEVMIIPGANDRQQIGKRDREEDTDTNVTNTASNTIIIPTNTDTDTNTNITTEAANPKPMLKLTLPKRLLKAVANDITTKMDVDDTTQRNE